MDALKKDDVEAFLACWPRESEIEQYLSDYEKFAKTKLPNDTSDANKKGRAIVEARHRMMFGKLRSFLVKTFGNIESIELTELVFDDMAKGIFPESGGYMKIRIPMFISTGNDHDHVVSIDVDGEYFSGNLYLCLSGLIDAIRVFDKNSPGDPRGSLIKYEDIKE